MENTLAMKNFNGRQNLKRTLVCRDSNLTHFTMALCISFLFLAGPLLTLLAGVEDWNYYLTLLVPHVLGFVYFSYRAFEIEKRSRITVVVHEKGFTYDFLGRQKTDIAFADIKELRFTRKIFMRGFSIDLQDGRSVHIPSPLERIDYVLDTICYYRPEICTDRFLEAREKAVIEDHMSAHNRDYFSRHLLGAFWINLAYPFFINHTKKRLKEAPLEVRRDLNFERSLEKKFQMFFPAASAICLAAFTLWMSRH